MDQSLILKAKNAESVEELLRLSKENNYPLTEEDAEALYEQLHASGEVSDDELDSVSGGGCTTKVDGHKYTVVSSQVECFTGKYSPGFVGAGSRGFRTYGECLNTDNVDLRKAWAFFVAIPIKACGNCRHLKFKAGTGYCGMS